MFITSFMSFKLESNGDGMAEAQRTKNRFAH